MQSLKPTLEQGREIERLFALGHSVKAIGKMLGRSHQFPYRRLKRQGIPLRSATPSPNRNAFHKQSKGGRVYAGQGYWRQWIAPDDPLAVMRDHHGYVKEHRLVMARALGRPLLSTETVHHIDGDNG